MSSHIGLKVHYLMASTGGDVIPSAKCTCTFWCLQPHHITCGLHPTSVDGPVDVHREVLLAGCWVTALPIFSCGIISVSPPVEVGLHGVGLVHLSHASWMPIHKGQHQPLMQWEEVSFSGGCMTFCIGLSLHKRGCLLWSDAPPPIYPLPTYPWSCSFP